MPLLRPSPADAAGTRSVGATDDVDQAIQQVLRGQRFVVSDRYATAITLQSALRSALEPPPVDAGHGPRRDFRRRLREASDRLLVPVKGGAVQLSRAPTIELLSALYPERRRVLLPVLDLQRLDKADEVHRLGVHLAVLGHRLHPFWGTYVPSRTEHLELFGTWLAAWSGRRERAVDVGTGSGVLALMLAKAGVKDVLATDRNQNALHGLAAELERRPQPVRTLEGDLLAGAKGPFDLVVFNPPWIEGEVDGLLDEALHYDDPALFERFFDQALEVLHPEGRVVVLFSDIGQLVRPDAVHPLDAELARGRLRLVDKLRRKVKGSRTASGRRRTRERVEVWELARA